MHCVIGSKHCKNKIGAVGLTAVTSDMSTESVLEVKLGYAERKRRYTRNDRVKKTAAAREYGINSVKIHSLHCNSSQLSRCDVFDYKGMST
jgi:hypothetical protein